MQYICYCSETNMEIRTWEHWNRVTKDRHVVDKSRFYYNKMHCAGKLKLRPHNTSYCLIEVVTKAGLTV
jgi:hypothetical protein